MKPLIGIVSKLQSDIEFPDDVWVKGVIIDDIRDAVCRRGCAAVGILPSFPKEKYNYDETDAVFTDNLSDDEKADLDRILSQCDGLILQGGMYGDFYELYVARYAISHNIPIMGICAGFNTLARAAGSNIVPFSELGLPQDRHDVYDRSFRHIVDVVKGTEVFDIFGEEKFPVNSFHTKLLDMSFAESHPSDIVINATITDRLENGDTVTTVEAFTVKNTKYAIGYKWHPEVMDAEHKDKVFDRFVSKVKEI